MKKISRIAIVCLCMIGTAYKTLMASGTPTETLYAIMLVLGVFLTLALIVYGIYTKEATGPTRLAKVLSR